MWEGERDETRGERDEARGKKVEGCRLRVAGGKTCLIDWLRAKRGEARGLKTQPTLEVSAADYGWYGLQPIRLHFEQELITNSLELSFNLMYICATRSMMTQLMGAML